MKSNAALALGLVFAVFLWGANNTGTKFILAAWPPFWTGASRFLCAGLFLLAVLHYTNWLGTPRPLTPALKRRLWWRGGLSLAAYILTFNLALRRSSVSHVALYLGASPVWALFWEGRPTHKWDALQRYGAAALAGAGVLILFWPALKTTHANWPGEILGVAAGFLWTNYGRQCRLLGAELSGPETGAHTMWRAGVLLLPLAAIEILASGLVWRTDVVLIQAYCIAGGGVIAFAIWNQALRHWPASRVLLFNNLIPLSSMSWARACLREPITPTFWLAMVFIVAGVVLGQANWQRVLAWRTIPPE